MSNPLLSLDSVAVRIRRRELVANVSAEMQPAEKVALVGRNGSGKSSLLRAIMGLYRVTGEIDLAGEEITRLLPHERGLRRIGLVPQSRNVFPSLSGLDNLELAYPQVWGWRDSLDALLDLLPSLPPLLRRRAGTLSSGERQLLALGMALIRSPQLLLLDEPLAGLDERIVDEFMSALSRIWEKRKIGVLIVEHRLPPLRSFVDTVWIMVDGALAYGPKPASILDDAEELAKLWLL